MSSKWTDSVGSSSFPLLPAWNAEAKAGAAAAFAARENRAWGSCVEGDWLLRASWGFHVKPLLGSVTSSQLQVHTEMDSARFCYFNLL